MGKKKQKYDWIAIKNEYCTTSISYRGLCEKYNIPFSTLRYRASKEKWVKEKDNIQHKIGTVSAQKITDIVIDEKVKINQRHSDLYEKGSALIEFWLDYYQEELMKFKSGEIQKPKASPYSLDFLMSSVQKIQKGQRLANNIENEDTGNIEPDILIIEGIDNNKI